MKTIALSRFRKPYNCAQTVYKSMGKHHAISKEMVRELSVKGGGRAEGGTCGALYAALQFMDCQESKNQLIEHFETHGGSTRCRELRKAKKMSCHDCVATAAEWAENCITKQEGLSSCSSI